jgi:hypothetical protein
MGGVGQLLRRVACFLLGHDVELRVVADRDHLIMCRRCRRPLYGRRWD